MKKLAALMALLMSLSCLTACDLSALLGGLTSAGDSATSATEVEESKTLDLLGEQEVVTLKKGESKTYAVNKDITGMEYIKLLVNSNVNLVGKFQYHDVLDSSNIVTEDFFIENGKGEDVEFKQFFDRFRKTGHGLFDKQLLSITVTNVDDADGKVQMKKASISNRVIDDYEREVYVSKGKIKVGADLATGGTLTYLQRLDYEGQTIDEVVRDEEIVIDVNAKSTLNEANGDEFISSEVNLINIFDAGRQFQQSYYANVGGTMADTPEKMRENGYSNTVLPPDYGANGYNRGFCKTADPNGYFWPYNPVQGGDVVSNPSQIIDYQVSDNEIYIKVRAMDWSKGDNGSGYTGTVMGGVTTKSYMENWYTIKGGMVYVTNRFVDWNGFEGLDRVPVHSNELPAAYVVHPFHNYVCYDGNDTTWKGTLTKTENPGSWVKEPVRNTNPIEHWFAWVNDNDFGVGVYVPGTDVFVSGRSNSSVSKKLNINGDAFDSPLTNEYRYNKPEAASKYTSCYVRNTSYTAPVVVWTMKSYVPMQYTYVISVDYVSIMRQQFKELDQNNIVDNSMLSSWN